MSFHLCTLYGLACLLLSAAGCGIELPSDRIACAETADCPARLVCSERDDGQRRCTREPIDAGNAVEPDSGRALDIDAGRDAGFDGARDTGPEDAGREAGSVTPDLPDTSLDEPDEPPREEAGVDNSPVGMNELPPLLRVPLPACGQVPDQSSGYFVSAGVGEDVANCGGPMGPCRSIHKALQRATDDGVQFVFLDNTDVFVEADPLTLLPGVIVVGGFSNVNGRWTRLCDTPRGKARLMSSGNPVLLAELDGAARIVSLTLETRAAAAGETMIGVLARGTTTVLGLENVTAVAADGGAGDPGAAGVALPTMSASCSASDGADGESVGTNGVDAVSGSFGMAGYTPSDGSSGGDGAPGHAGATTTPACATCVQNCDCSASNVPASSCGVAGEPGCGGAAGGGGSGGHGGGSSIALYVWDAHVFVVGGSLQSGAGGNGGAGGAAGGGGAGAAGAMGADGAACSNCDFATIEEIGATICLPQQTLTGPGSLGGTGGAGRAGGSGGSGAPGASYAAYGGGAAELVIADDTQLMHGEPGTNAAGAVGLAGLRGP